MRWAQEGKSINWQFRARYLHKKSFFKKVFCCKKVILVIKPACPCCSSIICAWCDDPLTMREREEIAALSIGRLHSLCPWRRVYKHVQCAVRAAVLELLLPANESEPWVQEKWWEVKNGQLNTLVFVLLLPPRANTSWKSAKSKMCPPQRSELF